MRHRLLHDVSTATEIRLDDIDVLDTENVCHVLEDCPGDGKGRSTLCGAEIGPSECHFGCVECGLGELQPEACGRCGRLICEKCIAELHRIEDEAP